MKFSKGTNPIVIKKFIEEMQLKKKQKKIMDEIMGKSKSI